MKNFNPAPPIVPIKNKTEDKEELNFVFAVETEAHENHPERNEDAVLHLEDLGIFGVFDGEGGSEGGEVASRLAVESIEEYVRDNYQTGMPVSELKAILKEAFMGANSAIIEGKEKELDEEKEPRLSKMGTTGTMVGVAMDGGAQYAVVANIGDSRAYVWDHRGLDQMTIDDDWLHSDKNNLNLSNDEKFELSQMISNAKKLSDLTPSAQNFFNHRNIITKYLGQKPEEECRVSIIPLEEDSTILITSDGIHDNLTTDEISEIMSTSATPAEAARRLKEKAIKVSKGIESKDNIRPKPDDMTVVVVKIRKS